MSERGSKTIRFRGRDEPVLDIFRVRGRTYFALEKLSRRGGFRVFDPSAGPYGDYRVLHRIPSSKVTEQKIEVLRRQCGPTANRNFPPIIQCTRAGDLFVVVGWVWGVSLRQYLRAIRSGKTPRPTAPEVIRLIRGLAHGLSHYHRRANIVHGDISPANIILTSGTTQLVLIDFGSAWPVERSAQKDNGDGITTPYAAPERITCQGPEDFRTDIFSLSVVAYELLTLELPYEGLGGQAGMQRHQKSQLSTITPPSRKVVSPSALPGEAKKLMDRYLRIGLSLNADSQFSTTAEWLDAMDRLCISLQKNNRLLPLEDLLSRAIDAALTLSRRKSL